MIDDLTEKNKKKTVTIIVNGRERIVEKGVITYEEVVKLAFGSYDDNPNAVYTVTYSKGNSKKTKGSLVAGDSVKVKEGMIFNVTRTDKS